MGDYTTGTYRSQGFGTTISNFGGGTGAVRIFNVYLKGSGTSNSNLSFYNGDNSTTANLFLVVSLAGGAITSTSTYFDSHAGVLFPRGCFITTSAAIDFGVIGYRTEVL